MARLAASQDKTGHPSTTTLVSRLIVEHFINEPVFSLDAALLFVDPENRGKCRVVAQVCKDQLSLHSEALSRLDPTVLARSLGAPKTETECISMTASELNYWLPGETCLPESCSGLLFRLSTDSAKEAMLLLLKAGFFTDEERSKLAESVSACGAALAAKLDYERMRRKSEEAASLISVINAINSAMDPQHLFQLIIEKAVEMIPHVDGAAVVTFDADGRGYHLRAGYGYYKSLIEKRKTDFDISEKMKESGAPFRLGPGLVDSDLHLAHVGIRSAICVPISEHNRKIGAILLESGQREDCFSEENIPLLRAFADSIGLAIAKLQSHQLLKEKYSRLEENTQMMAVAYPQLLQSEKLATVGELASSIAHDINNPLMTIMARTDILLSRIDPRDPMYKSIEVIEKQVDRIAKLVKGMLGFARMSRPEFKPHDINQVVSESILLTENHLKNKNIRLKKSLETRLPSVLADKNKLQQLFLNLISNATQAMADGGNLEVSAQSGTDRLGKKAVLISFRDTGCGIRTEDLGKIFDSFFTTKEAGTGLGLAIAKGIVDEHGGSISVESDEGMGTTVTVLLPLMVEGKAVDRPVVE
jgi:signal transduction histidine kinase